MTSFDYNGTSNEGSEPFAGVALKGSVYFRSHSSSLGDELFKSDGTTEGTMLVKDINPGLSNSRPEFITRLNDYIIFNATGTSNGQELWRSDGTAEGTQLIKDISPGIVSSMPTNMVNAGGTVYFSAVTPETGRELWKSDGTATGTSMIKDVRSGSGSSMTFATSTLIGVGNIVFFLADDGMHGQELWKSDGTDEGTVLVRDLAPGILSTTFGSFIAVNTTLYFSANVAGAGQELWKTDGTESGTVMVKDIWTSGSSMPGRFINFNGTLYFSARDGNGIELWKTDGTTAGTVMVKDISAGTGSSFSGIKNNEGMVAVGDYFYFAASDMNIPQLWRSDGTSAGTMMVKNINASSDPSISNLIAVGNTLFFSAAGEGTGSTSNTELWISDGTADGTVVVREINPNAGSSPMDFSTVNGLLLCTADDGIHGFELWRSDGSSDGTFMVHDLSNNPFYSPDGLMQLQKDNILFVSPGDKKYELWKSNGRPEGTTLTKDIAPGSVSFDLPGGSTTATSGKIFFSINDGMHGNELWVSDGTSEGSKMVKDIRVGSSNGLEPYLFHPMPQLQENVYFMANDGTGGGLWKSDGTEAGTKLVKPFNDMIFFAPRETLAVGNLFYFFDDYLLYRSDGTSGGTFAIKNINPSGTGRSISGMVNNNGILYFATVDANNSCQLWKSDGTTVGTVLVKDIYKGAGGQFPNSLFGAVNGVVYLMISDGINGPALWRSDGTDGGTSMLKLIAPGSASLTMLIGMCVVGDMFYFQGEDSEHGRELWKSDGTADGTQMVRDIFPGPASSRSGGARFQELKGIVYFYAEDGVHGTELWRSDGTFDGTYMVEDINPSQYGSMPSDLIATENLLFFTADDGTHGRQVWSFDPAFIKFDPISDKVATDDPFSISAMSYTGLPVSLTVVEGSATISGSTVTLSGSGKVTIKASQQGNAVYRPAADAERSFFVAKATQSLTFEQIGDRSVGDSPFSLLAASTSGLAVVFSIKSGPATIAGNTLTITGAGNITVKASQPGNNIYEPAADVAQTFDAMAVLSIEKSDQLLRVFPNPSNDVVVVHVDRKGVSASLISVVGNIVWSMSEVNVDSFVIDVSKVPDGLYLLQIGDGESIHVTRIMVN
ncbi:ELWxxDGT repeat protein [Chryseolinea sp. T2]|uniref:ELWxxDGT repeat protein n=1 Tax=Chryseolinea sp. T2 TaxID=3129255 RepID=UPI003078066A